MITDSLLIIILSHLMSVLLCYILFWFDSTVALFSPSEVVPAHIFTPARTSLTIMVWDQRNRVWHHTSWIILFLNVGSFGRETPMARDSKTNTGSNLHLIQEVTGLDSWAVQLRRCFVRERGSPVPVQDEWRIEYLEKLLEQRGELHYGLEETVEIRDLIKSIFMN